MKATAPQWLLTVFCAAVAAGSGSARAAEPDVHALLAAADKGRGYYEFGLEYTIDATCAMTGRPVQARTYLVRSKAPDAVATTQSPDEHKGDRIVVNGRVVWELSTRSRQPRAISLSERSTGLSSVGDIVSTGFADVYTGKIAGEERVRDEEAYLLALEGIQERFPSYAFVRYWVSKKTGLALRAEYLSSSKRTLKSADFYYLNEVPVGAKQAPFPSEIKVEETGGGHVCSIKFGEPRRVDVDPSEFDVKKLAGRPRP